MRPEISPLAALRPTHDPSLCLRLRASCVQDIGTLPQLASVTGGLGGLGATPCRHNSRLLICRDRPVPLPSPGLQLVSLTNVSDAAKLLASVPGNPAAVKQQFNLTSDRAITHSGKSTQFDKLCQWCFPAFAYAQVASRTCGLVHVMHVSAIR